MSGYVRHDRHVPPRTVSAPPDDWQRLASYVQERRLTLGNRTAEEVVERGRPGLSVVVVSRIENAKQVTYSVRTLRALCRGLDWSEDSVERILRGEEPVELESPAQPDAEPDLAEVLAELKRQSDRADRVEAILDDVLAEVAAYRRERASDQRPGEGQGEQSA